MMKNPIIDGGSFRDPAAQVIHVDNRILRLIKPQGFERFEFIKKILEKSEINNLVIETKEINSNTLEANEKIDYSNFKIFEHKKIDYISYPFEWSFNRLKDAALHHLKLHIALLENNATLIDASSYNIQFENHKPLFIDLMSIKEYSQGEFWSGHRQFCESFLNPLVLKSKLGVDHNNWFKGNLEGINTSDTCKLLKFKHMFSWNIFYNIFLLNYFQKKYRGKEDTNFINKKRLKKSYFLSMLTNLSNFIEGLKFKKEETVWGNYSKDNTYANQEKINKENFVKDHLLKNKFKKILDLGCNNGEYSILALNSGCENVLGLDFDLNAIDDAYLRSKNDKLNFLPLYFDVSNPSSNIGWNQNERKGFNERSNFDFVLALAFEHHLAIAKNIPLPDVIKWITKLAPNGIIEFVPKEDPTVQSMLKLKGDIFPEYNLENFKSLLNKNCKIISEKIISSSGRILFSYEK